MLSGHTIASLRTQHHDQQFGRLPKVDRGQGEIVQRLLQNALFRIGRYLDEKAIRLLATLKEHFQKAIGQSAGLHQLRLNRTAEANMTCAAEQQDALAVLLHHVLAALVELVARHGASLLLSSITSA